MLLRMMMSDKLKKQCSFSSQTEKSRHVLWLDHRPHLVALYVSPLYTTDIEVRLPLDRICATFRRQTKVLCAAVSPFIKGRYLTQRGNTRWRTTCDVTTELCIIPTTAFWHEHVSETDLGRKYFGMHLLPGTLRNLLCRSCDA